MAETTRATEVALMVLSGLISRQEQREHSTETLHQVEMKEKKKILWDAYLQEAWQFSQRKNWKYVPERTSAICAKRTKYVLEHTLAINVLNFPYQSTYLYILANYRTGRGASSLEKSCLLRKGSFWS